MDQPSANDKLAEIGGRYVKRTLSEMPELRRLLDAAVSGDAAAFHQIGRLAHRIHGSGAMFGFNAVSGVAGRLERTVDGVASGDFMKSLDSVRADVDELEQQVRAAAAARGV
jgi:HPt (histidine-containing phosphotransfer) domain-containing protein